MNTPLFSSPVSAGFPSPALDYTHTTLDICEFLIERPNSTFILKVSGDSMQDMHITNGDFVVVDKSIQAQVGMVVIAEIEGEFLCKELQKGNKGYYLKAYNPQYKDIHIREDEQLVIWGVVVGKFSKI